MEERARQAAAAADSHHRVGEEADHVGSDRVVGDRRREGARSHERVQGAARRGRSARWRSCRSRASGPRRSGRSRPASSRSSRCSTSAWGRIASRSACRLATRRRRRLPCARPTWRASSRRRARSRRCSSRACRSPRAIRSYYYTRLGELKLEMLAAAGRDARSRADNIFRSTGGGSIGRLLGADMGIININPANSTRDERAGQQRHDVARERHHHDRARGLTS